VTDACEARSSSTSSNAGSAVSARICSTAFAALAWLRTAMTTWAPLAASTFAVCRPSPPFAPVTTAVRPVRSGSESRVYGIGLSLFSVGTSISAATRPVTVVRRVRQLVRLGKSMPSMFEVV